MAARRYRVIQWATGNTGQRALREVIRHPTLDLVGVRVYSDEKDGVDAGELCGEDTTGINATTDRDAVLAIDADCCVYMARATGSGQTRAGLTEDELVDDLLAPFLEVQDWRQYTEMLTQWSSSIDTFAAVLRRVTETGRLVYYAVEERHTRRGKTNVVNSMTVFAFDDADRIRHLDVYLQQAR
jgi:hypothetical protein